MVSTTHCSRSVDHDKSMVRNCERSIGKQSKRCESLGFFNSEWWLAWQDSLSLGDQQLPGYAVYVLRTVVQVLRDRDGDLTQLREHDRKR